LRRYRSGPGGIAAAVMPRSGRLVLVFNNRAGAAWGGALSIALSEARPPPSPEIQTLGRLDLGGLFA